MNLLKMLLQLVLSRPCPIRLRLVGADVDLVLLEMLHYLITGRLGGVAENATPTVDRLYGGITQHACPVGLWVVLGIFVPFPVSFSGEGEVTDRADVLIRLALASLGGDRASFAGMMIGAVGFRLSVRGDLVAMICLRTRAAFFGSYLLALILEYIIGTKR